MQALAKSLKSQLKFPRKYPIGQIQMANTHDSILSGGNSESRDALVVLEGLDHSGKTSQSSRLLSYLEGLGHSAELWRFPDRSTDVGQYLLTFPTNHNWMITRSIFSLVQIIGRRGLLCYFYAV